MPGIIDALALTESDVTRSIVAASFMADYGVVKAVNGELIDVTHLTLGTEVDGVTLRKETVTTGVEVLFPMMSGLSITGTIAVGDGVLLIGLRNPIPAVSSKEPQKAVCKAHYSQETIKAIPLSSIQTASVQFGEDGGKAFLRNSSRSLFTLLDGLEAALATFMGAASQSSITSGAASSASLAAALVALMASFTASTATMRTDLGLLLRA
jgi:hypothetical protein